MTTRYMYLLAAALIFAAPQAVAALRVFACEPEWGALARDLGGDQVEVHVATTARQDPHRIEARPSLIARARSADLVVCTGAALETGWLPLVLAQSGNARIQPGRPGYFEASRHVAMREVPASVDRAQGDVHAAGNPHIHLDPHNVARVAAALAARMGEIDPKEAAGYAARSEDFLARWGSATAQWEERAAKLRGIAVVVHHKDLYYLLAWLGMREVGTLEPRPGLPPTSAHLSELMARLKTEPAKAVLRSSYSDPRASEWLSQHVGIPAVVLPFTVGGSEAATDLFGLFDDTLSRLLPLAR